MTEKTDSIQAMWDSLPEPRGWQPIETAPKDGTEILVADGVHTAFTAEHDVETREWLYTCGGIPVWAPEDVEQEDRGYWRVTEELRFWMPLPDPPRL